MIKDTPPFTVAFFSLPCYGYNALTNSQNKVAYLEVIQ